MLSTGKYFFENNFILKARDAEPEPPEPAFFDPTGAGAGSGSSLSLKRAFFNCREYLFGKYVECKFNSN